MTIELPETPELIQQENNGWKVKIGDNTWLAGDTLVGQDCFFVNEHTAYKAAHDWWLMELSKQFRPVVSKQPVEREPWWVEEGKSDYRYKFD